MTHRDGVPHASRLGFSARRAWCGDTGHHEPWALSTRIGPSERLGPQDFGKPPFRSRARIGLESLAYNTRRLVQPDRLAAAAA